MANGGDKNGSWIEAIQAALAAHPDARVLSGYLWESQDKVTLRLYSSLRLNEYIELKAADTVARKTFGSGKREPATTVLWVKAGTIVTEVRATKLSASMALSGKFLRGEITEAFLSGSEISPGTVQWKPPPFTAVSVCWTPCLTHHISCIKPPLATAITCAGGCE